MKFEGAVARSGAVAPGSVEVLDGFMLVSHSITSAETRAFMRLGNEIIPGFTIRDVELLRNPTAASQRDAGGFPTVGTWLSLVEHSLGVRGVGSSNLPVPTIDSSAEARFYRHCI